MLKTKKLLKLSRNGQISGNLEKGSPDLDDSIEDFIVARPPKTARKLQKASDPAKNQNTCSEVLSSEGTFKSCDEASTSSIASAASKLIDVEKISPYFGAKVTNAEKVNHNVDHSAGSTSNAVSQKVTVRKKSSRKVGSKRGCADPSDMALALALSESIQMAGEIERQNQEEMLLQENLVDVIAELRNEVVSEKLAPVFLKSPPQPVTKVKRKGRGAKKAKEYVLLMRTQTERERMIAEQAAAVLQQAIDTCKGERVSFAYTEPNSNLIKQYQQRIRTLWERTALVNDENSTDETIENFYVAALRSVLSPPKKTGYTNILFHVSQLPGRGCSQIDPGTLTATQAVLEQLAFAAEGGFVDDPDAQKDQPTHSAPSELVQDWSRMIDNPLMSDIRIKTMDKQVYAHRLVFAVRFPQLLNHLTKTTEDAVYELDWSDYSNSSAKKVLQFVYTADYEHDETVVEEVCHICRRFDIRALSERIPNHEQYSFLSLEGDDDAVNGEERLHNVTPSKLDSGSPKLTNVDVTRNEELLKQVSESANSQKREESDSDSDIEELSSYLTNSPEKIGLLDKSNTFADQIHDKSQLPAEQSYNPITPQKDLVSIAEPSGSKPKVSRSESLSPDMFQDTIYDSRCEEAKDPFSDASEVIDLTQDSGRSNSVCSSPMLSRSCELDPGDARKNGNDSSSAKLDPKLGDVIEVTTETDDEEVDVYDARPSFVEADSYRETSILGPIGQDSLKPFHEAADRCSSERPNKPNELSPAMNFSDFDKSSFFNNSVLSTKSNSASETEETPTCFSKTRSSKRPSELLEKSQVHCGEHEIEQSIRKEREPESSPVKYADDSFSAWENYNDGVMSGPFYPSPGPSSFSRGGSPLKVDSPTSNLQSTSSAPTRQPDPTPYRVPTRSLKSKANALVDMQTPDGARPAKKRKVDVTPLPNYLTMDTPGLKKELDKFGLKPMKRKNAVKLLNHIYEELHPLVTDSECSFQDTPERPVVTEGRQASNVASSPSKSSLDRSSQEESENSLAEDEESMIVTELDRQNSLSPRKTQQLPISLHDRMKQFFQKRPDLYKQVLTYEPIEFEFLYKEVRKDGNRCKAEELLDWLDQQCITCRMKTRDRARKGKNQPVEGSHVSPKKTPEKAPKQTQGRRVAKKLIT